MKDENILYWIWLSERCGAASKDFGRLVAKYENPFDIYRMEEEEIERIEGVSPTKKLALFDKSLEDAYAILRYCKQKKIDIITYADKGYPSRLRSIEDPPVLLYVSGRLPDMDSKLCIGIVGTRKMSEYGRDTAYKIAYELSAADGVVVSGMALGIDGVAAAGALAAGGQTVAVLGCGISVVYPKAHSRLMSEIVKRGAVITEYSPFTPPNGYNFPKRNRIISGICQGTLVVEGASDSGAMITAKRAIDQGRELFALPGKVNESNSEGPNELIKSGALVALSADDIILHYDFLYHDCINYKGLRKAKTGGMPVENAIVKYGVEDSLGYRRVSKRVSAVKDVPEEVTKVVVEKEAARKSPEPSEAAPRSAESEVSSALLATLDDASRRVLDAMPVGRAISPDGISADGMGIGDIITALTMLEISGLVQSLPGGAYIRK